jgi:hypothetical protein
MRNLVIIAAVLAAIVSPAMAQENKIYLRCNPAPRDLGTPSPPKYLPQDADVTIDLKNKTVDLNIFGGQYPITQIDDEVIIAMRMDTDRNKPLEIIGINRVEVTLLLMKNICAETRMPLSLCAANHYCTVLKKQF